MKYIITLEDTDNGGVKVTSMPDMKILAAMARGRDITPAGAYALGALSKVITDSQKNKQEEVKARFDAGLIPATPSARRMFS